MCMGVYKAQAQPNCEAYKWKGDTLKCEACHKAGERAGHYQFSRAYQEACDRSLAIDSTFGYAYKIKSTAYLKSGDMITWMALMDKAVKINPKEYLSYRAWCRYQFFRDYQGAIDDIEALDAMVDYDIGDGQNGDYHLQIARALCYKALGQNDAAIDIIESKISSEQYYQGPYDYLHLGVLYFEAGDYIKALEMFNIQEAHNPLAENDYYHALTLKAMGNNDEALKIMRVCEKRYRAQQRMLETYTHHDDKIFLSDIDRELNLMK